MGEALSELIALYGQGIIAIFPFLEVVGDMGGGDLGR